MSNKMRIKIIIFLILILGIDLWAFQPNQTDFVSHYQYNLYRSWLAKSKVDLDVSATFSNEKIVKIFSSEGKNIVVEYPWKNHLITGQRERLEISFSISTDFDIKPYLHYAESLVYRLNCADRKFAQDLLEDDVTLEYKGKFDVEALALFWKEYGKQRIFVQSIEVIDTEKFGFSLPFADAELKLWFATDIDISGIFENLERREETVEAAIEDDQTKNEENNENKIKQVETELAITKPKIKQFDDFEPQKNPLLKTKKSSSDIDQLALVQLPLAQLPLVEFIREAHDVRQSKELLNNKITNIGSFLKQQYPGKEISQIDDVFYIKKGMFQNKFGGDIIVSSRYEEDCVYIEPLVDYQIRKDTLYLPNNESIQILALKNEDVTKVVAALPHLIYAHRALDSKLINFLLIHDNVPTTLIVHSDKRELYNVYSYANLLLMLSRYWKTQDLYFSISEIKMVNGQVELVGYLVADGKEDDKYDMAEVWFRLNDDYQIDLIMMMLHPQLNK